jgi:hypothetical protein
MCVSPYDITGIKISNKNCIKSPIFSPSKQSNTMMNTKMIIGVVVGGFLVFLWQFLSWAMFNMHGSEQKYTADQDAILQMLGEKLPEEGSLFFTHIPTRHIIRRSTKNDGSFWWQTLGTDFLPQIHEYGNMGMNMFRGFLTDIVAVFLLVWLIGQNS